MKSIEDTNFYTLFGNRELTLTPQHFVVATTPLSTESRNWILESTVGRFSIIIKQDSAYEDTAFKRDFPAFEDPKEAILYELTWS